MKTLGKLKILLFITGLIWNFNIKNAYLIFLYDIKTSNNYQQLFEFENKLFTVTIINL